MFLILMAQACNLSRQYRGWNPDKAVEDYYLRIRDHEKYYETVDETTWPFIRIINASSCIFLSCLIIDMLSFRQVGEKIMVNVSKIIIKVTLGLY